MRTLPLICLLITSVIAVAGCGKKSAENSKADRFGTNKLETVFITGSTSQKNVVHQAEAVINQQNYGAAYDLLQNLSRDQSLTPEQAQAIKDSLLELGNVPRSAP